MNISELAAQAYAQFERRTRDNGDDYYTTKDGTPEWIVSLVRDAHGDMLPDDWRYDAIHSALSHIADSDAETRDDLHDEQSQFADSNVDTYNGARTAWLGSHLSRIGYVNEATETFGPSDDVMQSIGMGQYMESEEVFASVVDSLSDRLDEIEDESDDDMEA
ncbi:MAG: hypothetical protein AB7O61_24860 [Acidimicrobiia bacterium]